MQIAKLKQQETELTVELQKAKLEEREREFQALVHEAQQRKVQYYLEGLEVERNRLAKELHDNVSNELLAIKMKIADGTSSREEVLDTLQALQTEVRGISHDLICLSLNMLPCLRFFRIMSISVINRDRPN